MLSFSGRASAAERNIKGWFTLDVPDGWAVSYKKQGGNDVCFNELYARIDSPDGSEAITFEYASAEGLDSRQFAENASGNLGGSSPVVETDHGKYCDYGFVFTDNGAKTAARAFMIESVGIVMRSRNGNFDNLCGIIRAFNGGW